MKFLAVIFSFALFAGVAVAGEHGHHRVYLQGTGNITHADGSMDKYLVSMLMKKQDDGSKVIYCRYLGFDFDYMNKLRIVKHEHGAVSIYSLAKDKHHAHSEDGKIGHGFMYKDDAFHLVMHMHNSKGHAVDVHFETEAGNPDNVIVRGMASKNHSMVHMWENRLSKIYSH
ncbi:MAG: hypothetical protein OYH77_06035 [Pseudomonadota bacterium]|nr:hypothetical protein [Pseudomonadota bacterium]